MKYDFDTPVNRRGTDSVKWNVGENELPMWIADMDFQAAPEIRAALRERLEHGIYGYTGIFDDWYEAYIYWWKTRHNWVLQKSWLMFCTGVVPAISSIVRKLTTPNENVVVQTPVYNMFFNSVVNNGRRVLENPLIYENGEYRMDLPDLERKLADPQTSLMILCNPHNPVGRIWEKETLAQIGRLAKKYHVTVISDEIHCDLTELGVDYVPFASASEDCRDCSITCIAPTKTFSIPGLQTAAISVPDPFLRHKVWRGINTDEVAEGNCFACTAAIAAYTKGAQWLDELRAYVSENRRVATQVIAERLPQIHVVPQNATYLMWVDISKVGDSEHVADHIRAQTGLFLTAGSHYGEAGRNFLRINIACPRSTLLDGLQRLEKGIESYRAEG